MPRVSDILQSLEQIAPTRYTFEFDKVGLQVGDPHQTVTHAVVALDRSLGAVRFAQELGAQLLLTHHPLIFSPLNTVDTRSHVGRTVFELVQSGISFIAAHTNWDSAQGGINDTLAQILGLKSVKAFGSGAMVAQRKLTFLCPQENALTIIDALSSAGAEIVGTYQTHPLQTETLQQLKVEMVLREDQVKQVVKALERAHPAEQPPYDILTAQTVCEQPAGRIGDIDPLTFRDFVSTVSERLDVNAWAWGDPEKKVRKVAVVGGAADGEWIHAQRAGADVLVTGEVKQHVALEAAESGLLIIAAGHYQTEHPGCETLRNRLAELQPDIEWTLYAPKPGFSGRPL